MYMLFVRCFEAFAKVTKKMLDLHVLIVFCQVQENNEPIVLIWFTKLLTLVESL